MPTYDTLLDIFGYKEGMDMTTANPAIKGTYALQDAHAKKYIQYRLITFEKF